MYVLEELSGFSFLTPACPIQDLNKLDGAHPHWWGQIFFTQFIESYLVEKESKGMHVEH